MESWAYWWSDKSCTYQDALCRELSMMQNCNRDRLDAYTRMAMSSQNAFNPLQSCKEEMTEEHNAKENSI